MGRSMRTLAVMATALMLLISCSSSSSREERILINHHKEPCQGSAYQTCLLTRESEQQPWAYFYDSIENFDFEWGYQYQLRVRVTDVANPPADASSKHYSLIEQVQTLKVDEGTDFDLFLMPYESFTERLSATEFRLGQEITFHCELSTCDSVASLLSQEMAMVLSFQHANDATGRLRLQKILCSDSLPQFYDSCVD